MSFIWPGMLLLLALIPIGVWLYRLLERRRRRRVAAFGGLGQAPADRRPGFRSRIPSALFIIGLTIMTIALARPQGTISLPSQEGTVILAFDVSGSMGADDLKPTRMDAAKAASKAFVERQPPGVVIGVVAFSDAGLSVQVPTKDQATVLAAIDRLTPQRGTSLGQGILASLHTIALADNPPPTDYYSNRSPEPTASPTPTPVPAGTHAPAVIVLLTDGENNESPDPIAAAQTAADQGVRIYTVGIGSVAGSTLDIGGFKVHTQLDEPMLQQISQITDGGYYSADNEQDLRSIYDHLDTRLVLRPENLELTSLLAGASALILVLGGLGSLLWMGRLP